MFRLVLAMQSRRTLSTTTTLITQVMYEYNGNKRWSGLRNGVGGVAIYMGAKTAFQWYTGYTGAQFGAYSDSFSLSPFEIAAFAFVISQQAIYLRKLVSKMTVSEDNKQVQLQVFNFIGQPTRKAKIFNVDDLELTIGTDKLFLKPRFSKKRHEYFILQQRDAKIEQLFSGYETF